MIAASLCNDTYCGHYLHNIPPSYHVQGYLVAHCMTIFTIPAGIMIHNVPKCGGMCAQYPRIQAAAVHQDQAFPSIPERRLEVRP